ncbi:LOW QUALITY PROTEIN: putative gustatory receptor clone PTE01 [Electrophorus electricus]|uniref:LOW QUALITY PROTEIN: putative gustatory receptor clone PTE01 n=1 Tax=Electrophorus electricus TaxID=8005 RepID=UPI0015D091C9|nr:LOW QUALITY PROTEIN: putative gustatory receptor clone PTE01 [Electrophorus electricus]
MSQGNQSALTVVTEFFIIGFPGLQPEYYNLLATLFFVIYVLAVFGNSVLVVSFTSAPSLQKPMYITMLSLALSDIGFCTVALPKIISRYWFDNGSISFSVCLLQRQFIHYFGTLNSLIMMIMALDRYLAICFPLRYPVLMTNRTMTLISGLSWASAMITPSIGTIQTAQMLFCGPNLIIHCYCDGISLYSLACGDITLQLCISTIVGAIVLLLPFSFIIFSYFSIGVSVIRTTNNQGRLKAFSTCATQLSIICIYYIPRMFVYLTPYLSNLKMNSDQRIAVAMFYGLFPPLVNPLIYYFRTKEIHLLLQKWCSQKKEKGHKMNIVAILK